MIQKKTTTATVQTNGQFSHQKIFQLYPDWKKKKKGKKINWDHRAPSIVGANALLTSYNEGFSVPQQGTGSLKLEEQESQLSTPLFFKLHGFLEILNELPDKTMLLISKCVCILVLAFAFESELLNVSCGTEEWKCEFCGLGKTDVLTFPLSHCGNKPHAEPWLLLDQNTSINVV